MAKKYVWTLEPGFTPGANGAIAQGDEEVDIKTGALFKLVLQRLQKKTKGCNKDLKVYYTNSTEVSSYGSTGVMGLFKSFFF